MIASHGQTGLKRHLLGSVAEKVGRHSKCPVLLVKN
ncbi:MAG: universal stress protein [Deltaproteobacteria bacterium]|nr:universal stress protein [Deltaproteobacteria bacterium]